MVRNSDGLNPTAHSWPLLQPASPSQNSNYVSPPQSAPPTVPGVPGGNDLNPGASTWSPRSRENSSHNSSDMVQRTLTTGETFNPTHQHPEYPQQPPYGSQMQFAYYDDHFGPLYYIVNHVPSTPAFLTVPTFQPPIHAPHPYGHHPVPIQTVDYYSLERHARSSAMDSTGYQVAEDDFGEQYTNKWVAGQQKRPRRARKRCHKRKRARSRERAALAHVRACENAEVKE